MNTYITDIIGNVYAVRATRAQVAKTEQVKTGLMQIVKATAKLRKDAKLNITVKNLVIRNDKLTYL